MLSYLFSVSADDEYCSDVYKRAQPGRGEVHIITLAQHPLDAMTLSRFAVLALALMASVNALPQPIERSSICTPKF